MDIETKLKLLDIVESYWDLLPPEIKDLILKYKESQELIEWRESPASQWVCLQIRDYGRLRRAWYIGPIQCKCYLVKTCLCHGNGCVYNRIYGHYWRLDGVRDRVFLGYDPFNIIPQCAFYKCGLRYQTNDVHSLNVIAYM